MGDHADGDGARVLATQLQSAEVHQVIVAFIGRNCPFDGRDITGYLRKFEIALHPHGLTDFETRCSFLLALHPDVEEVTTETLAAADRAARCRTIP